MEMIPGHAARRRRGPIPRRPAHHPAAVKVAPACPHEHAERNRQVVGGAGFLPGRPAPVHRYPARGTCRRSCGRLPAPGPGSRARRHPAGPPRPCQERPGRHPPRPRPARHPAPRRRTRESSPARWSPPVVRVFGQGLSHQDRTLPAALLLTQRCSPGRERSCVYFGATPHAAIRNPAEPWPCDPRVGQRTHAPSCLPVICHLLCGYRSNVRIRRAAVLSSTKYDFR